MFVSPYENTRSTILALNEHGVLYPPLVGDQLASAIMQPPDDAVASAGALERVAFGAGGAELVIKGWARMSDRDLPADCVVIGYEAPGVAWKPFTVIQTGRKRQDIAARSGSDQLIRAGFNRKVPAVELPSGELTFRAWSVTLAAKRAVALNGAVTLRRP